MEPRKLGVYDFFQTLQIEWIVADLRARIYPSDKDKAFWNKVKEGKKKRIEGIANQNQLPTIFTDEEMLRILEVRVYQSQGLPKFTYRDEATKAVQQPLDFLYYYNKGADVRFEDFGVTKVEKIKSFDLTTHIIHITYEGQDYTRPSTEVTRII